MGLFDNRAEFVVILVLNIVTKRHKVNKKLFVLRNETQFLMMALYKFKIKRVRNYVKCENKIAKI